MMVVLFVVCCRQAHGRLCLRALKLVIYTTIDSKDIPSQMKGWKTEPNRAIIHEFGMVKRNRPVSENDRPGPTHPEDKELTRFS